MRRRAIENLTETHDGHPFSGGFRQIHIVVSAFDISLRRVFGLEERNADRGTRECHLAIDGDRLEHPFHRFLNMRLHISRVLAIHVEKNSKLVSSDPGDEIRRSETFAKSRRDRSQDFVACGMPQTVVDDLEAVEIDVGDGELSVIEQVAGNLSGNNLIKTGSVWES